MRKTGLLATPEGEIAFEVRNGLRNRLVFNREILISADPQGPLMILSLEGVPEGCAKRVILTRERVRIRLHNDTDVSTNEIIGIAGAKKMVSFVGKGSDDLGANATQIFLNNVHGRIEIQQISTSGWTADEYVAEDNRKLVRHPKCATNQWVMKNAVNEPSLRIDGVTSFL